MRVIREGSLENLHSEREAAYRRSENLSAIIGKPVAVEGRSGLMITIKICIEDGQVVWRQGAQKS